MNETIVLVNGGGRRASDITTFVINLEHIGDIIDHNFRELAEKKFKHELIFSSEGFADITALFNQTLDKLKVAMAIFVSSDIKLARQLVFACWSGTIRKRINAHVASVAYPILEKMGELKDTRLRKVT
jgi:phosphate:Na+ symporter